MIEDFLARSNVGRCHDFRETADVIAKVIMGQLAMPKGYHWEALLTTLSVSLGKAPSIPKDELGSRLGQRSLPGGWRRAQTMEKGGVVGLIPVD